MLLNEDELAELINSADSANAKKQIQYAVRRLEAFEKCAGATLAAVEAYDSGVTKGVPGVQQHPGPDPKGARKNIKYRDMANKCVPTAMVNWNYKDNGPLY